MSKQMFVVMEVKDLPSDPGWVIPVDREEKSGLEAIKKSRVIYADEMTISDGPNGPDHKHVWFKGVSPTPETQTEWKPEWTQSLKEINAWLKESKP